MCDFNQFSFIVKVHIKFSLLSMGNVNRGYFTGIINMPESKVLQTILFNKAYLSGSIKQKCLNQKSCLLRWQVNKSNFNSQSSLFIMPRGKLIEHTVWAVNQCSYIMSGEYPDGSGRGWEEVLAVGDPTEEIWGFPLLLSQNGAIHQAFSSFQLCPFMVRIRDRVALRIMHLRKQFIPINTKQIKMGSTGAIIMPVLEGQRWRR